MQLQVLVNTTWTSPTNKHVVFAYVLLFQIPFIFEFLNENICSTTENFRNYGTTKFLYRVIFASANAKIKIAKQVYVLW